jgi:hypothetical protein
MVPPTKLFGMASLEEPELQMNAKLNSKQDIRQECKENLTTHDDLRS